jgi:hypothetical protein
MNSRALSWIERREGASVNKMPGIAAERLQDTGDFGGGHARWPLAVDRQRLRQPVFLGLRTDKRVKDVVRE